MTIPHEGCSGDGMGEPSTCQIHMAPWYRVEQKCEVGRDRMEPNRYGICRCRRCIGARR